MGKDYPRPSAKFLTVTDTDTAAMSTPTGINGPNVTAWLMDHAQGATPPFTFELIAGGHSNLTFRVTDTAGNSWALRRPPLRQVLATAHDMEREHKIIAALHGHVPVPAPIGLCVDPDVNERPFYVMEFVPGAIVRTEDLAREFREEDRGTMTRELVKTLAQIHAIDVDEVGLDDLGKKEDYIARQLRRWMRQYDDAKIDDRPQMRAIHDHLAARIPDQGKAGIVHGDYRLDNCMIVDTGPALGSVAAVLDWELCTLGDTMADVSQLLSYWAQPGDESPALANSPTLAPGFGSREDLLGLYEEASGRSLDNIDFYLAFSAWRLASILEGVYSRYVGGAMGDKTPPGGIHAFVGQIEGLITTAERHAELC